MVSAKENVLSGKTNSNTPHPENIEEVVFIADETVPAIVNAADSNLEATAIDENQKELRNVRHFRDEPYELRNELRGHPTARIIHDDYEDLRGFAGNSHHRRYRDASDYRY